MTYEIDPNTGLPALPEDYFWRVTPDGLNTNNLELRKKSWLGSWKIHGSALPSHDKDRNRLDPQTTIVRYAKYIMNEFHNPWEGFYGDYPPKKLEQK